MRLLERTTPDLSDNPFTRTEPVRKCGTAAQLQSYTLFGVAVGYCISGSSSLDSYSASGSSGLCTNGTGDYNSRFRVFSMDIYEVSNQQSFSDSVQEIVQPNTTATPTSGVGLTAANGSLLFLAITTITVLFSIIF